MKPDWNPESTTDYPGSTIQDPKSTGWDLESEGHLDSFTLGVLIMFFLSSQTSFQVEMLISY